MALQPAPMLNEPLSDISGNARKPTTNGSKPNGVRQSVEDAYLDSLLDQEAMSEDDAGFIEDDDGAGYAEQPNHFGKRPAGLANGVAAKRHQPNTVWQPRRHEGFQPGSTPWKGDRRYMCLNFTGYIWTVDQETHNTVSVEFYDREGHRNYHFTDPAKYDKACLSSKGALFSCQPSSNKEQRAILHFRPHEAWTHGNVDWKVQLPQGESVVSMSLSESYIVALTSNGYVRVYTLFGVPLKVYRQKSTPVVTCASWRDYVMIIGNGPIGGDGTTRLVYTIENLRRDEICQSEDIVALPEAVELRSVFFSDKGDPCIYDSQGVLLILLHWRSAGQAKWVPLLDTKLMERLASGKKEEAYWPVAVAQDKFHCFILKGGEQHPYFPQPIMSEFEFHVPLATPPNTGDEDDDNDIAHQQGLEETFVRASLQHSLLQDLVDNTNANSAQIADVHRLELEVDKSLLPLLAAECREGEDRGMKALEIVSLMRDRSGKMLEAAGKIAARFQRDVLRDKITQLAERRLVGLVDDEDI
jgi:chromosome transmission fidelity protein 4